MNYPLPDPATRRLITIGCMSSTVIVALSQAVMLDINPPENHAKAMAMW